MGRLTLVTSLLLLVAVLGCPGEGSGTGPDDMDPDTMTSAPTLSGDVQPIFTANCALSGCHSGASPQQGMNLSAGQSHANTVNVPSAEVPSLFRITPGEPDSSYLVHKIQGTQAQVGGFGSRMPLGGAPLSTDQITTIRAWISAGALDN